MAKETSELARDFGGALTKALSSLVGLQSARGLIAAQFPDNEIMIHAGGDFTVIRGEKGVAAVRAWASFLGDHLARDFGYEFTDNMFRSVHAALTEKRGADWSEELMRLIPEGFLERERVRYLSKEELEKRVLERTKELEELNVRLEQTVLQRTKELVAANAELENVNKRLEETNETKSEFLSLVSHQLRVPLTSARWGIMELSESLHLAAGSEQKKLISSLLISNDRMIRLVNNLLNVARIDEGRIAYQFGRASLGRLIEEAIANLSSLAQARSVTIAYETRPNDVFVQADTEKLYLAIENVIENAVKYSPPGKKVSIGLKKETSEATVAVTDEGIGIPEAERHAIFDKFFRAQNARQVDASGTGLGLFIVKRIIEDHGGHVRFDTQEGKGTTFFMELPILD